MSEFASRRFGILLVGSYFLVVPGLEIWSRNHCLKGLPTTSRNDFLMAAIGSASVAVFPGPCHGAAPITERETDSLAVMAKRALRPKPPKVLRRKLSQDFAVLLMRSSYNALDQLDCVAMDQFQRDFFLIRRSEYETYLKALGPGLVQQGELTDPYYFDFISFAQYEAINREISNDPPYVFEEQQALDVSDDKPQTFVPVVIRRDPTLTNDKLGPEHSQLVGSAILDRLEDLFGATDSAIPTIPRGSRPDPDALEAALRQLVNLFLINGYAMGASVSKAGNEVAPKFIVSLNSPANLWGGRILWSEGYKLNNDYLVKTAMELIRRAGFSHSFASVRYDGTIEEITLSVA